jgi:hypothetical protein
VTDSLAKSLKPRFTLKNIRSLGLSGRMILRKSLLKFEENVLVLEPLAPLTLHFSRETEASLGTRYRRPEIPDHAGSIEWIHPGDGKPHASL